MCWAACAASGLYLSSGNDKAKRRFNGGAPRCCLLCAKAVAVPFAVTPKGTSSMRNGSATRRSLRTLAFFAAGAQLSSQIDAPGFTLLRGLYLLPRAEAQAEETLVRYQASPSHISVTCQMQGRLTVSIA